MKNFVLLEKYGNSYWYEELEHDCLKTSGVSFKKRTFEGKIIKRATAESFSNLDWSGTRLDNPKSQMGWLSREGRFYGCDHELHDQCAEYLIKQTVGELEKAGWARVCVSSVEVETMIKFSAEQRNWLSKAGWDPDKWEY